MDPQLTTTTRGSREDIIARNGHSSTLKFSAPGNQDFVHYYRTQYGHTLPLNGNGSYMNGGGGLHHHPYHNFSGSHPHIGRQNNTMTKAPLAKFDDTEDLQKDYYVHKVPLFKALFIFFNSVILLLGLAIAGLGVFFILDEERAHLHQLVMISLTNPGDEVKPDLQPMMYFLSLGLIGSGLAMTLVALINLFSASKESQILLFIGIFFLTLLFAAQLTLGFFGITFHLRAQEDLRHELVDRLQTKYNEPGGEYFSPALDYTQARFQCCGISSPSDYDKSFWKKQSLGGEDLVYPLTCCNLSNRKDPANYLNPMARDRDACMSKDSRLHRNERHMQGCIADILDWSTLEFVIVVAISLGCALVEILGTSIGVYLIKHIRRRAKETAS